MQLNHGRLYPTDVASCASWALLVRSAGPFGYIGANVPDFKSDHEVALHLRHFGEMARKQNKGCGLRDQELTIRYQR